MLGYTAGTYAAQLEGPLMQSERGHMLSACYSACLFQIMTHIMSPPCLSGISDCILLSTLEIYSQTIMWYGACLQVLIAQCQLEYL